MPRYALLLSLVLLAPGLAGCLSTDDSALAPAGTGDAQGAVDARASPEAVRGIGEAVTFPIDGPREATRTFEGSFSPQEACLPAGCPTGLAQGDPVHRHVHEITEMVPRGVPVALNATLTSDADSGAGNLQGGVDVTLHTPHHSVPGAGSMEISEEVLLRAPGPVELVVEHAWSEPDQASVSYELTVQTRAKVGQLAPGVPVGLTLAEGDERLGVSSPEAYEILVSAWTLDGEHVGTFTSDTGAAEIPTAGMAPGEIVLLLHRPSLEPVRLHVPTGETGDASAVRLLETTLVEGEPMAPSDEGAVSWSFSTDQRPVAVGLVVETGQTSIKDANTAILDPDATHVGIEGPNGTVLSEGELFGVNCVPCYPPRSYTLHSGPGEEDLVPGSYDVTIEGVYGDQTRIWHQVVTWER